MVLDCVYTEKVIIHGLWLRLELLLSRSACQAAWGQLGPCEPHAGLLAREGQG